MADEQPSPEQIWEQIWDAPSISPKKELPTPDWFTAKDLLSMDIPIPEWVVPGILPEGLTILAARPKMGKSWLALNIGICVSHHLPVFDSISCPPGDVLYLALEDTKGRLKSRYKQCMESVPPDAVTPDGPDHFTFGVQAIRLDEGLAEQICGWISTRENPRLVIVDTLSKVRPQRKGEGDSYSESYLDMGALKDVADKEGVGMMVVHHTRKATADDALEEVMGSTGFTGAADAILVLKRRRMDNAATLLFTGRDIEDGHIPLVFDPDRGMWIQEGPGGRYATDSTQARVLDFLMVQDTPVGPDDISRALGDISREAVRMALRRLMDAGQVHKPQGQRGKYALYVPPEAYDDDEDAEE